MNDKKIIENNVVYEINEYGEKREVGKIAQVELSIEHPAQMLGISRVESAILLDEQDNELMNDPNIIDDQEYYSDNELIKSVANHYKISTDLINLV